MQPPTFRFRQKIDDQSIADPYSATREELLCLDMNVMPGQTVAVTAGSRGIADIVPVMRAVVDHLLNIGLAPFIVPAMGSHAGATAESQQRLLADYGLTEAVLGVPVRSSMETVQLGELDIETKRGRQFCPIFFDRVASQADHIFLVNRIKSHTRFSGPIESGLLKMLMIGLGNAQGASAYHRAVSDERFSVVIRQVANYLMRRVSVLGGLGIVENGLGRCAILKAIPAGEIFREEAMLLQRAKDYMPRLPFEELDLLFVQRIGKDISGTGMDTNIVGRKFDDHKAVAGERPIVHLIAVCGLTVETVGNANGIGMAEFCLSSVLRQVDWRQTRLNAITANHVSAAMIPLDYETEEEIIEAACRTLGCYDVNDLRIAWIRDTLHLEEMIATESLRPEILAQKNCKIL